MQQISRVGGWQALACFNIYIYNFLEFTGLFFYIDSVVMCSCSCTATASKNAGFLPTRNVAICRNVYGQFGLQTSTSNIGVKTSKSEQNRDYVPVDKITIYILGMQKEGGELEFSSVWGCMAVLVQLKKNYHPYTPEN